MRQQWAREPEAGRPGAFAQNIAPRSLRTSVLQDFWDGCVCGRGLGRKILRGLFWPKLAGGILAWKGS